VVFYLKINLTKSELVLVGNANNVDGLVGILGYRVSSLPLKYLGFRWEPLTRTSLFGIVLLRK
jgi:hypothetical protein